MLQLITEMRDTLPKSGLHQHIDGGKDPNYLVRSWASRLGTVTQGHKVPKSDYRSKWLQRLNRVELMQNVEVQQTLRNMMSIIRAGDKLMQDADSAYQFAERRRIQKCHATVCKIRAERELTKSSNLPTEDQDDSEIKPPCQRRNDRNKCKQKNKLPVTSLEDNAKINRKFANNTANTHCDNLDDIYGTFTQEVEEKINNNNEPSMSQAETNSNKQSMNQAPENYGERKIFFPPIPEKLSFNGQKKEHNDHSLPTLDTKSKFSIIKRAQELRNERGAAQVKSQNLSLMFSQLQRKYSKERQLSRKIEIFGDNRKILAEEPKTDKNEITPTMLPLLDSKSFSDIDCNDFLNLKNRMDHLSPTPAVLDHKLHWPTKTNNTFLK